MTVTPSNLSVMRNLVRNYTGRYTPESMTDSQIDTAINQYYQFLLPNVLRTFKLRVPYVITTIPNQDTYNFPYTLFNSVEPQAYSNGYFMTWIQDRSVFYSLWPKIQQIISITTTSQTNITNIVSVGIVTNVTAPGNNFSIDEEVQFSNVQGMIEINGLSGTVTAIGDTFTVNIDSSAFTPYTGGGQVGGTTFSGTINAAPFLRCQVAATNGESTDTNGAVQISNVTITLNPPDNGAPIVAQDTSFQGNEGFLTGNGVTTGQVNYLNGEFFVTYTLAPPSGSTITASVSNYGPSRPIALLFFNNQFVLRPVPDQVYNIEMVAYKTPTQLISSTDSPELKEWLFLLAAGGAKIIFQQFPDPEGQAHVEKILQEQIDEMETRTIAQLNTQRTQTIFSTPSNRNYLGYFLPYQNS